MKKLTVLFVVLSIVLMSSCAAPVATQKPIPTNELKTSTSVPTDTPTPTVTSTPIPTDTPTPTMTPTPEPIYTKMGLQVNEIAEVLGWQVVICDDSVITEEDLDKGIFLYREDTGEFFCDLEGHMPEPVPQSASGEEQYLLCFNELKGLEEQNFGLIDSFEFALHISYRIYFPSPSTYNADELTAMTRTADSLEELRTWRVYTAHIRTWPLTYEEFHNLASRDFLYITMQK